MTRRRARHLGRATDREVGVVAAVLATGSEKAAAHRLGLSHSTVKHHLANARSKVGATTTAQLVWMLAPRLPEPEDMVQIDEKRSYPGVVRAAGVRKPARDRLVAPAFLPASRSDLGALDDAHAGLD